MKVVSFAPTFLLLYATGTTAQVICSSAAIGNATASPGILRPPNGKFRAVTVSMPGYTVELTGVRQDEDPGAGPQRKGKNFIEQIFDAVAFLFETFFRGFGNLFGFGNGGGGENSNSQEDGASCEDSCDNPGTVGDAWLDPNDKAKAYLRSERLGQGDGRIYKLDFIVTYNEDAGKNELRCTGSVDVCVPKSRGGGNNKNRCVESPTLYPSY